MRKGNIYEAIPDGFLEEMSETLIDSEKATIERIISASHRSPEGFWYDQDQEEWVMLLQGSGALRFEHKDELVLLKPGDWVNIPAHTRHRIEWTDPDVKTVWLAVRY